MSIAAKAKSGVPGRRRSVARYVEKQFPGHFKDSESLLIAFVQAYYEWEELAGNVVSDTYQLTDFMDVDRTDMERFGQYFRDEFLSSIPPAVLADKTLLIKHVKQFYRSRGSEKSFKFLFRIMYDEDIEIEYPSDSILRTSDGIWLKRNKMKLDAFDGNIEELPGRKIFGTISGASAIVETIDLYNAGSYNIAEIEISSISGIFLPDEPVETRDDMTSGFPKILARILGQVTVYIITNPGTGYITGDIIPFTGPGDGEGLIARIGSVDFDGSIKSIQFVDTGVGFTSVAPVPDMESLSAGTGAQIEFRANAVYYSPGEYLDTRGQPSSLSRLQDGRYYQDYSYNIKSNLPISEFRGIVNRLVHPAGMGMYATNDLITETDFVGFGRNILYHLSHPEDENYNDPDNISDRKFFEPEIQKETQYVTIDILRKQYPGATIGELFDLFLNKFWSILTPRVRTGNTELEQDQYIHLARSRALTYLDLYDEDNISAYQNMVIGDIEPWTGYPNPRNSDVLVIPDVIIDEFSSIHMARARALTYIDLYDEDNVVQYQNMVVANIEPWTGYPNARESDVSIY